MLKKNRNNSIINLVINMYILLDVCSHSGILRLIYFGLLILDIITTVVPICLILMLLIDFTKAVVSNDKDIQIKSTKTTFRYTKR